MFGGDVGMGGWGGWGCFYGLLFCFEVDHSFTSRCPFLPSCIMRRLFFLPTSISPASGISDALSLSLSLPFTDYGISRGWVPLTSMRRGTPSMNASDTTPMTSSLSMTSSLTGMRQTQPRCLARRCPGQAMPCLV